MQFKYKNEYDYMDIELLDSFIDTFFNQIIAPLGPTQEAFVSFTFLGVKPWFHSNVMIIRNDPDSLHYLKKSILSGSLGSYLRIHEDIYVVKCYFTYRIHF